MPLQKLQFKPGVDRENTRYAAEGGWYETDKVRFRRGMPQKIGGWVRLSATTFLGICRSMLNWTTLLQQNLVSVGTNLKYYIERGGEYFDVTPIRATATLTNPFTTTSGSATVLVADVAHGALQGDFVTFSGASAVGGLTLNGEFQISRIDADSYIRAPPSFQILATEPRKPRNSGWTESRKRIVSSGWVTDVAVAPAIAPAKSLY